MTGFLSIIWRELVVNARQKATQRSRLIAAATMVAIFAIVVFLQRHPSPQQGSIVFTITYSILFLQALISGIHLTADSLSEEKREGTLGLLYLSGLRGGEIVLGKMAIRSLRGLYSLLATFPVFGFCILFGGVEGSIALRAAVTLLTTMFFSLAVGVFISSRFTDDKAAFAGTVGLLGAFCFLPGALFWIILHIDPAATWADYIRWLSPFHSSTKYFWMPTFFHMLIAVGFLAAAAISLNFSFRKQFAFTQKIEKKSEPRRKKLLNSNPFRWLLSLDKFSPRIAKLHLLATLLTALFVAYVASNTPGAVRTMGDGTILYAFHFTWKLLLIADAMRWLHHDHRSGGLELLLTTPIDPNDIIKAQYKHSFSVFFPGAVGLCLANAVWYWGSDQFNNIFVVPLGGAIFIFLDSMALRWTAMLQALKPSRFPTAVVRLIAKIVVVPLLILWLVLITAGGLSASDINAWFFVWFIACATYDAVLIKRAKTKLQDLRLLATSEPVPEPKEKKPLPKPIQWLLLTETQPGQIMTKS